MAQAMGIGGAGGHGRAGGYTYVELVTLVAIVAVASALAYPSFAGMRGGHELETAAVGLTQQLRSAHWRAVSSGIRVRVASRQGPDSVWRFTTQSEQGAAWVAVGDEVRVPLGTVVAVAGVADKVFNPDGTCSMGSVTLRGAAGALYRCTLAAATGRVRLYRGDRETGRGL